MSDEATEQTVLGTDTVELTPTPDGGAELELSDDLASILDLNPETTVEVSFRVVDDTDIAIDVEFPDTTVTEEQRTQLVDALNDDPTGAA